MSEIRVGGVGQITTSGNYEGIYVMVEETTGGFLVFTSPYRDFRTSYDDWVAASDLDGYFKEAGWDVVWDEE